MSRDKGFFETIREMRAKQEPNRFLVLVLVAGVIFSAYAVYTTVRFATFTTQVKGLNEDLHDARTRAIELSKNLTETIKTLDERVAQVKKEEQEARKSCICNMKLISESSRMLQSSRQETKTLKAANKILVDKLAEHTTVPPLNTTEEVCNAQKYPGEECVETRQANWIEKSFYPHVSR